MRDRGGAVVERVDGRALGGAGARPWLYASTKTLTLSIAALLLVASVSHEVRIALVVNDCCRWDSWMLDVANDADTDADTDER